MGCRWGLVKLKQRVLAKQRNMPTSFQQHSRVCATPVCFKQLESCGRWPLTFSTEVLTPWLNHGQSATLAALSTLTGPVEHAKAHQAQPKPEAGKHPPYAR